MHNFLFQCHYSDNLFLTKLNINNWWLFASKYFSKRERERERAVQRELSLNSLPDTKIRSLANILKSILVPSSTCIKASFPYRILIIFFKVEVIVYYYPQATDGQWKRKFNKRFHCYQFELISVRFERNTKWSDIPSKIHIP